MIPDWAAAVAEAPYEYTAKRGLILVVDSKPAQPSTAVAEFAQKIFHGIRPTLPLLLVPESVLHKIGL